VSEALPLEMSVRRAWFTNTNVGPQLVWKHSSSTLGRILLTTRRTNRALLAVTRKATEGIPTVIFETPFTGLSRIAFPRLGWGLWAEQCLVAGLSIQSVRSSQRHQLI
jgi:hypothetical protein